MELTRSKWYKRSAKRLGRGSGSGRWNYSTKWQKGQNSRSGWSKPDWFEGGQIPLMRRIPKLKWFKRYSKLVTKYELVNLGDIEAIDVIKTGSTINKEVLLAARLIDNSSSVVKVLNNGDLTKKVSFEGIEKFSKSAKATIEDKGWKIK